MFLQVTCTRYLVSGQRDSWASGVSVNKLPIRPPPDTSHVTKHWLGTFVDVHVKSADVREPSRIIEWMCNLIASSGVVVIFNVRNDDCSDVVAVQLFQHWNLEREKNRCWYGWQFGIFFMVFHQCGSLISVPILIVIFGTFHFESKCNNVYIFSLKSPSTMNNILYANHKSYTYYICMTTKLKIFGENDCTLLCFVNNTWFGYTHISMKFMDSIINSCVVPSLGRYVG